MKSTWKPPGDAARTVVPSCPFGKSDCPISLADLTALGDYVERGLARQPCEHALMLTREFCAGHGLPVQETLQWLQQHCGFCDCEVVLNVAFHWEHELL